MMQLLKTDRDSRNPELSDVPPELHGQELVDFAAAASKDEFLVVLGTKLVPEPGAQPVYHLFAFNGRVVVQDIVPPTE